MKPATLARAAAVALAGALAGPACVPILGDYTLSEATEGAPCQDETQTTDCPKGYACYASAVCLKTCNENVTCGRWHRCGGGFCSRDVGAECEESRICGAGSCVDRDAAGNATTHYCTIYCSSGSSGSGGAAEPPCPDGYACVDSDCLRL